MACGTRSASARSTRRSTPAPPSSLRATPYHYSSYDEETEVAPRDKEAVIILGSGPNRIGQGIEFDYSCVHASLALQRRGLRDRDGQLQPRDRLDRLRHLRPALLRATHARGRARDRARRAPGRADRRRHLPARRPDPARPRPGARGRRRADRRHATGGHPPRRGARRLRAGAGRGRAARPQARHGHVIRRGPARSRHEIGYPVLVRPSYVLGGRGMEIVYDDDALDGYISRATEISPEHPVLVDRFIDDAVEIDVDAIYDGEELYLGGVMEHIEEAGIHSGDSACALPPITLGAAEIDRIRASTEAIARGVGVRGLINIQFALASDVLYVLEANPRACRTVPFVSKATAVPLAKAAARVMLGETIAELRGEGLLPADGRRRRAARRRADRRQGGRDAVQPLPRRSTAAASTPSSARRCARPARSWASTRSSARRSPSPRRRRTARCRLRAACSSRWPTATSAR